MAQDQTHIQLSYKERRFSVRDIRKRDDANATPVVITFEERLKDFIYTFSKLCFEVPQNLFFFDRIILPYLNIKQLLSKVLGYVRIYRQASWRHICKTFLITSGQIDTDY